MQVQVKLVRALCNYEFAKYCWKVLVRPNLQEASLRSPRSSSHSRRKLLSYKIPVTDWLLDRRTSYSPHSGSFHYKMQNWMSFQSKGSKKTSISVLIPYDLGLLVEVREFFCTVGNGTTGSTPLLSFRISDYNFSVILILFRSSATGFACDFEPESVESQQYMTVMRKEEPHKSNKAFKPPEGAQAHIHCETTVEASYLNTKHNKTDILIEPFFCFVNGSHQTNKASFLSFFRLLTSNKSSRDFQPKEGSERTSSSLQINCP